MIASDVQLGKNVAIRQQPDEYALDHHGLADNHLVHFRAHIFQNLAFRAYAFVDFLNIFIHAWHPSLYQTRVAHLPAG